MLLVGTSSDNSAPTLARPLSQGMQVVAAYASFAELEARRLLAPASSNDVSFISHRDVDNLYDARCRDQHSEPNPERRARFHAFMAQACCGQRFILRQAGLGPESVRSITRMLMENEHVTHLDLSGNNVNVAGARAIARLLRNNDSICVLQLQSANLSDGSRVLCEALRQNDTLTALDLSGIGGVHRNSIWGTGVQALASMLANSRVLSHLDLGSCGLQKAAAEILNGACSTPSLTSLGMAGNHMGDDCASAIRALLTNGVSSLEKLNLSHNGIKLRGAKHIAEGLSSGGTVAAALKTLDLSHNEITGGAVADLARGLGGCASLTSLDLSGNLLTSMGVDVDGFRIPDSDAPVDALFAALAQEENVIAKLVLHDCELKTIPPGLPTALESTRCVLKHLDVSNNPIGDAGATIIADGMKRSRTLTALRMQRCRVTDDGIRALASAVEGHVSIEHLYIAQGTYIEWVKCGMIDAVEKCDAILSIDLPKDQAIIVEPKLVLNKEARLKQCAPKLAETRRANYVQQRNYDLTKEAIAAEVKGRERLTEAYRVRRERQKAQMQRFREELAELREMRDEREHEVSHAMLALRSADEEITDKMRVREGNAARLKQQAERQTDLKTAIFNQCVDLLNAHFELHPPSNVSAPPFVKISTVKASDGNVQRRCAVANAATLANLSSSMRAAGLAASAISGMSQSARDGAAPRDEVDRDDAASPSRRSRAPIVSFDAVALEEGSTGVASPSAAGSDAASPTSKAPPSSAAAASSPDLSASSSSAALVGTASGHQHPPAPSGAFDPAIRMLEDELRSALGSAEAAKADVERLHGRIAELEACIAAGGRAPPPLAAGLGSSSDALASTKKKKKGGRSASAGSKKKSATPGNLAKSGSGAAEKKKGKAAGGGTSKQPKKGK